MSGLRSLHTMNLFSRFFQENQEKFLAFAYSYLRDKAEAEDVVMESMIALWENRDRWEENSNLHALLLTIIKNKALHVLDTSRCVCERKKPSAATTCANWTYASPP